MQENLENNNDMSELVAYHMGQAFEHLRMCEVSVQEYLAELVASVCDVTVNKMFEATDIVYLAHARWFYWYCYRYMTSESYDKIASQDFHCGHRFNSRTVQNGVNKISAMIDNEPLWKLRWRNLKQIIKTYHNEINGRDKTKTIIVQIPKELKGVVNIEIKEI